MIAKYKNRFFDLFIVHCSAIQYNVLHSGYYVQSLPVSYCAYVLPGFQKQSYYPEYAFPV